MLSQVALEPDARVLGALGRNTRGCGEVEVLHAYLDSDGGSRRLETHGYNSRMVEDEEVDLLEQARGRTVAALETERGVAFSVLVLDCEGCFLPVLRSADLSRVRVIILELDQLEERDHVVAALAAWGFEISEELWNTSCCITTVKHIAFERPAKSGYAL